MSTLYQEETSLPIQKRQRHGRLTNTSRKITLNYIRSEHRSPAKRCSLSLVS